MVSFDISPPLLEDPAQITIFKIRKHVMSQNQVLKGKIRKKQKIHVQSLFIISMNGYVRPE